MRIKLDIVTDFLDHARAKLADRHPMLLRAGELVAGEIEENFRQRGRPRWAGNRPLVKTGRLKSEATRFRTEGNLVHIGEVLDSFPYASILHNGSKKMPARPYLYIPNLVAGLVRLFKDHILGG